MTEAVRKAAALLKPGDKVLVGLSGGADSMCLTHILCSISAELGITVAAAHMNHGLRGEAADNDAKAAQALAERLGIEFHLKCADVSSYARGHGLSEELAGRMLRYEFFEELCAEYGYTKIATAHNKNDNAETLLMNFIRGTSLAGLGGIPAERGKIIRPLLSCTRAEIEDYCVKHKLPYVTDATNLETVYTRNKIRLELIPAIARLNPNFIETVTRNAAIVRDENDYIRQCAGSFYNEYVADGAADLNAVNSAHPAIARRVIMRMITDAKGSSADSVSGSVEDVLALCRKHRSGKRLNLPGRVTAAIEYDRLVITCSEAVPEFAYALREGENVIIREIGRAVRLERCGNVENDGALYMSADDISDIQIRNRREGDVFCPAGMNGSKKLKKLFADLKIPASQRMAVPIITVGTEIAAVYGIRADKRFVFGKNKINFRLEVTDWKENLSKE